MHVPDGYHLDDFNIYFEIVDPDEEGYGELVATTLARRTMPFIRYRVQDVTRFIDAPCPCGAPLRRIERIRGRRDEMVVMGAGNMYPEIFERILHDVGGIAENWQVVVRQEGLHDVLEFRYGTDQRHQPFHRGEGDPGEHEDPLPRCLGEPSMRHVPTQFPFSSSREHRAGKEANDGSSMSERREL